MQKVTSREALAKVLVVEDDEHLRFAMCGALRVQGFSVVDADSLESATRAFVSCRPDVVVTDLRLPDGDALELLHRLQALDSAVAVFIVTGYGTIDLAVRAVKQGAEDFLTKPVDVKALGNFVRGAVERRERRRSGSRPKIREESTPARSSFQARSSAMKRVEEQVEKLRDVDCTVLLLGETGTGKSVLARRIHEVGARCSAPFVDINCAGLAREFVESELFGHERGAFTGAHAAKQGLFESANGGTLFLDEIGDIDLQVQPKLLKALEEKRFRRMGDVRERSVDVRLLAATHHALLAAIAQKQFRADLYYRISTICVTLPALRERREDLLPLAYEMLAKLGAPHLELTSDAKQLLLEHAWPGNLRELKNVLERATVHTSDNVLTAHDLRLDSSSVEVPAALPSIVSTSSRPSSSRTMSEVEREHILGALDAENGRVEAAARRLGIPRSTLYQRIKNYGITSVKRQS